jgi:LPS-assembly lipoprotein
MSWSDRRRALALAGGLLAALALGGLGGCGYAPAAAPGGAGGALVGAVLPAAPDDAAGFAYVARIEDRLGRATLPRYRLDHRIVTRPTGEGITAAGAITRFRLDGRVDWQLVRLADGAMVAEGTAESFTGWFTTSTTVATLAAEEDALRRLMTILADQTVTRLLAAPPE